jgi:hypothetical protein
MEDMTAAGYPSHNLISGSLSPPFFEARRRTTQSLKRPEQNISARTIPTIKPIKKSP